MTPGNNIYTLLINFIAFSLSLLVHLFHLRFKLFISHKNSHITLGPPVLSRAAKRSSPPEMSPFTKS